MKNTISLFCFYKYSCSFSQYAQHSHLSLDIPNITLSKGFKEKNIRKNMERKSCCGGRSYVSSPCTTQPKKEPVVSPKKEEDVKKETAEDVKGSSTCGAAAAVKSPKAEEREIASVKKEEKVKVNV